MLEGHRVTGDSLRVTKLEAGGARLASLQVPDASYYEVLGCDASSWPCLPESAVRSDVPSLRDCSVR